MEEKKSENKKLTYDQLEAYANQISIQAEKIYKDNQDLAEEVKKLRGQLNYSEITLAFKVLENKDCFNKSFVDKVVCRLEEILVPKEKTEEKEPEN